MPDEYIKRDDALQAVWKRIQQIGDSTNPFVLSIRQVVREVPAADVAPVIRCRDCKHAMMTYSGECKYCKMWMQDGVDEALYLDGDFYCAFAERKGENAEVR